MGAAPRIETERLLLRAHESADFAASCALWGHEDVARFIGGRTSSPEEVWSRLLRYAGLWSLLGYGYFAVVERESGRMVGEVGLADFRRNSEPTLGAVPEAGWVIHPACQGRGYAFEAMTGLLAWAAGQGLDRSCCIIDPDNAPSLRLAARLGYAADGEVTYHGNRLTLLQRGA